MKIPFLKQKTGIKKFLVKNCYIGIGPKLGVIGTLSELEAWEVYMYIISHIYIEANVAPQRALISYNLLSCAGVYKITRDRTGIGIPRDFTGIPNPGFFGLTGLKRDRDNPGKIPRDPVSVTDPNPESRSRSRRFWTGINGIKFCAINSSKVDENRKNSTPPSKICCFIWYFLSKIVKINHIFSIVLSVV